MNAEHRPHNPTDFQFNPDGALWKVSKERMILLAGSSALLKQLAYPPVAEALRHTGRLEATPARRLRTNAQSGFNLIFGTIEENQQINERINEIHRDPDLQLEITETTGVHLKGTRFSPRTQEGLGLVGATLIEGSVEGYRRFVEELPEFERNEYVTEAKMLFGAMGLQQESLPNTYDGIREHIQKMVDDDRLAVGRIALELAPYTILAHSPLPSFIKDALRLFTFDLLPQKLLDQYGFKITPGERKAARRRAEDIRRAVPHMPDIIRFNPQYRRARRMLEDQQRIAA